MLFLVSARFLVRFEYHLIQQLVGLGYKSVKVMDGNALVYNLKIQLETLYKASYIDK
jgi:type I restriction enzyme R subunit